MCDREKGGPCIFSVYRELKEQFVLFAFAITRNERSQTAGERSWNGRGNSFAPFCGDSSSGVKFSFYSLLLSGHG